MKKQVLFYFFVTISIISIGQTTTTSDGNWNTGGNWNSGVPADGGTATILNAMTLNTNLNINDGSYTITTGSITDNSGGTAYDIDVRGAGYFEVGGKVFIEGDLEVHNFGEFILKGCDTMIVEGDVEFRNDSEVTIESCAVFIIGGNLGVRNSNSTIINGTVSVGGDLVSRNGSTITGTGNLQTAGEIDIRNSSQVFGSSSDCNPGPCEYGTGIGLPVELTAFYAAHMKSGLIKLNWITASEINNDFFTIEYSINGKDFFQLKTIKGFGNSNKEIKYETIVNKEFQHDIYIRLMQTDFDGAKKIYNPIYLRNFNTENNNIENLTIHPNPGNGDFLRLKLNSIVNSNYLQISIRDISGALINSETVYHSKDDLFEKEFNQLNLESGIYFISITSEDIQLTSKYLVK